MATEYTFAWSDLLIKEAELKNMPLTKIEGQEVNFENIERRIKKIKPKTIFFNGHGNSNAFYDNAKKELINLNNSSLLAGTITFARSCESLVNLGPISVQNGCRAFIGYNLKFLIPRFHKTTCKPLQDPVAKPVMECSNKIFEELLKGNSVQEAVEKSHQFAERMILDLIYSPEPYASASLFALSNNDSSLDFCGNPSARME